jgi:hypothetical protein
MSDTTENNGNGSDDGSNNKNPSGYPVISIEEEMNFLRTARESALNQ